MALCLEYLILIGHNVIFLYISLVFLSSCQAVVSLSLFLETQEKPTVVKITLEKIGRLFVHDCHSGVAYDSEPVREYIINIVYCI